MSVGLERVIATSVLVMNELFDLSTHEDYTTFDLFE